MRVSAVAFRFHSLLFAYIPRIFDIVVSQLLVYLLLYPLNTENMPLCGKVCSKCNTAELTGDCRVFSSSFFQSIEAPFYLDFTHV